ncbi:MAG: FAD-linked oxidase C-terminal domain-containing protein, partial [Cryobacterium sp.]
TPAGDDAARTAAQAAFEEMLTAAIDMGGTVTGEHGVGLLKLPGAAVELGERVGRMHHAVKDSLDPEHLFNPGKAFS